MKVKNQTLFTAIAILLTISSCTKYDQVMQTNEGMSLPPKVENAKSLFMKEVSRVMTRGEYTSTTTAFNAGSLSADWESYDINTNGRTRQENVEVPIKTAFKHYVTQTLATGEKRRIMCYSKLIVTQTKDERSGVFLVYYVPSAEWANLHHANPAKMFNNKGDMGDYSGLKVYTKLDGPITRINKYENGKKVAGVYFPKAKNIKQLKSAVAYGARLLNGIKFSAFKNKSMSGTRCFYDDCEEEAGPDDDDINDCEEEVPEEGDPDVEWIEESELEVECSFDYYEALDDEELRDDQELTLIEALEGVVVTADYEGPGIGISVTIIGGTDIIPLPNYISIAYINAEREPDPEAVEELEEVEEEEDPEAEDALTEDEDDEWKPLEEKLTLSEFLRERVGMEIVLQQQNKIFYDYKKTYSYNGRTTVKNCHDLSVLYCRSIQPDFVDHGGCYDNEKYITKLVEQIEHGKYYKNNTELYSDAIQYMVTSLDDGKPILVGVDDGRYETYNGDKTTEHFVAIYGYNIIENSSNPDCPKVEFYFIENAVSPNYDKPDPEWQLELLAFNAKNVFEYQEGNDIYIHGCGIRNKEYIISHIRMQ